jgi:hypothetical protein
MDTPRKLQKLTTYALLAAGVAWPSLSRAQIFYPGITSPGINLNQAVINRGMTGLVTAATQAAGNPLGAQTALNQGIFNQAANPYLGAANPYLNGLSTSYANNPYSGYGNTSASPYSSYYETEIGGYLRGSADIISGQGKWFENVQQALSTKEHNKQERIATGRKRLDEYLYEREKLPTFEDERQRALAQLISRSLNNPPVAEIWSGQALNYVLADIRKNQGKSGHRQVVSLDEDVVKHINLTPGTGNPGLLKNDGRLAWPVALLSDDYKHPRDLLSSLAPEAVRQAIIGRVDPGIAKEMNEAVTGLRDKLTANVRDMTPNQYIEAGRFLGQFGEALKILVRPDAGDFISPRFAAKGMNVADLVRYMTDKGLAFAPAVEGDESAYQVMHQALVTYDIGTRAEYTAGK